MAAYVGPGPARYVEVRWFGPRVKEVIRNEMTRRMHEAVTYLHSRIRENINVPVGRNANGNVVERSQPGEYPRRDTGEMYKKLGTQVVPSMLGDIAGYVGSAQDYAIPLEKNLDREWLSRTLFEELPALKRIFGRRM